MPEQNAPNNLENPWRQAFRESRAIVVVGIVVSLVFVLFAANVPPLIRKDRKNADSVTIVGENLPPATIDSSAGTPDSTATQLSLSDSTSLSGTTIDSSSIAALTPEQLKAQEKQRQDSVKQAKTLSQARLDSVKRAQEAQGPILRDRLMAQAATMKEIDTEMAKKLFDLNEKYPNSVQFIDARSEHQFEEGHIPGAMNAYAEQWQSHIPQIVQIPRDRHIVVYCGGGQCELSHELADNIRGLGYTKISIYTGGTTEWKAKFYPMTK
jgi:ArsR family transcriptional regulator